MLRPRPLASVSRATPTVVEKDDPFLIPPPVPRMPRMGVPDAPVYDDERAGPLRRLALVQALTAGAGVIAGPNSDLGAIATGLGEGVTAGLGDLDADYQNRLAGHTKFLQQAQRYNVEAEASERELGYEARRDYYTDTRDRSRELQDDRRDRTRKLTDDEREQRQSIERLQKGQQYTGKRQREVAEYENELARTRPTYRDRTSRMQAGTSAERLKFEREKEGIYQQDAQTIKAEIDAIKDDIRQARTPTERRGLRQELREAEARMDRALRGLSPSQRKDLDRRLYPNLYGEQGLVQQGMTVTPAHLEAAREMLEAGEITQEEYDILLGGQ